VPANAHAVASMTATAPAITTSVPISVSMRSYPSHRGVIRLSTTLDC